MPIIQTSRYSEASVTLNKAQALLNDPQGALWFLPTSGNLAPPAGSGQKNLMTYFLMAYEDLLRELGNNGVQVRITVTVDLPLTNGVTNTEISDFSAPQLPTDCIVPLKLWEQPTGSGDLFVPMKKVDQLPNLQPGAYLVMWQWQDDQINLTGATQDTTVQIEYESALIPPVVATDPVMVPYSSNTLAKGTAAYAALSGAGAASPNVAKMFELFQSSVDKLIRRYVNAGQYKSRRRRPYGYRRRIVYL